MKKKLLRMKHGNNQMNLFGRTFGQEQEEDETKGELSEYLDQVIFTRDDPNFNVDQFNEACHQ